MKETGLMFKAPLVRAILDGSKTQTRRIAKTEITMGRDSLLAPRRGRKYADVYLLPESAKEAVALCPVGQVGDRIYVRETWQGPLLEEFESDADSDWMSPSRIHQYQNPAHCQYAADGGPAPEFMTADDDLVRCWRPAIHMPKWAARIWLEVTGVRVERLHQITDAECWAEGAVTEARPDQFSVHSVIATDGKAYLSPRGAFSALWESTGGDWAANPWVWVIDFKRIEKP